MKNMQISSQSSNYQISEKHIISQDVGGDDINCLNLFINDKESRVFDKRYYNKERRIKDIKLCINFDNYFANLASILKFSVEAEKAEDTNMGIILSKIEKDLIYLQENYTVVEREYKDKYTSVNIF